MAKVASKAVAAFRLALNANMADAKTGLNLCLASVPDKGAKPAIQRVPIAIALGNELKDLIGKTLADRADDLRSGDMEFRPYDPMAKLDSHQVEVLELKHHPAIREQVTLLGPMAALPDFAEDEAFIEGLRFSVVVIEHATAPPISIFRTMNPKKELQRSKFIGIILAKGHFDLLRDRVYLLDRGIDCMSVDGFMFIFQKANFHLIFQFYEEIVRKAQETLEVIHERDIIDNFDEFEGACLGHQQKLAKLCNIATRPYLATVTVTQMKAVAREFGRSITFRKVGGKERVVFDPSDKWEILRLLDDDFLASKLTGLKYEVNSKRAV
jgi:hypothetical protein